MKKLIFLSVAFSAIALLAFANVVSAQPEAVCVPWNSSDQDIPHYTYSGAEITLKGIARGGATEYRWDFDDGGSISWTAVTDPYNLGVKHTYNGFVGQSFLATLYVRDGLEEAQDEYRVKIYESSDLSNKEHLDVRIRMSIDEGLWWLHTNMVRNTYTSGSPGYGQPYGYWDPTSYYPVGSTATSVDAFQEHGSRVNGDYNGDPYVETAQRGLNYLLHNTYSFNINVQTAGDPDTNGNGIGLVTNQSSSVTDGRQTYLGGICMVTLASSGAPNVSAAVGGANIYGRTYADIVQDMVDFWAWGQIESSSPYHRGGWRYYANHNSSDMSTAQWPPLGMLIAEREMGATVPQFVRDELALYLNALQNTALNNDNGCFGYTSPAQWPNITKAAAGIICHEFLGTPLTDPKVESAIGFIYRHWNDTGTSWDHTKLHGNSYGMYGTMKAFRIPNPDIFEVTEYDYNAGEQTANSFDWFYTPSGQSQQGLASYIVSTQQSNGSWDDNVGSNQVYDAFCTGWRILTLLEVGVISPEAVICDCHIHENLGWWFNQDIPLDGSCSDHPDNNRSIVSYEWDVDYDGSFETDGAGVEYIIEGGYALSGIYPVALRVTDDNPAGALSDIYVCNISVHEPPHCPHPDADGPYECWVNESCSLDASGSTDPDNEIESYDWDLDNDGLFGAEDDDCFGEPSDAVGINPEWTWDEPYIGTVGLKVCDEAGIFEQCCEFDSTTVDVGNHAPVSDSGGPYGAPQESCITLDGTGSSDPDPGDAITYAWDLDNDGEFADCSEAQCEFCVGPNIGTVYDVCLKVTDSFSEYDIACTTIEIVSYRPFECFGINEVKFETKDAKCKGITLMEVTSDQGVFVYEPESGKDKLGANTTVDDGVNGPQKIHTSCSKPIETGDVFGAYTVTDLVRIMDDVGSHNNVKIKGTLVPAVPIDLDLDDVTYTIDDGEGNTFTHLIPAGSFEVTGKPEDEKYEFKTEKGSVPDIKAKFDFGKCKFELDAKKVTDTSEITGMSLTVGLRAGINYGEEVVAVEEKHNHLKYKAKPKHECCPKCKGITLMEVTSDQGVFVYEPEPGKDKLGANTTVDDGVNAPQKIHTSCSKPIDIGDVFGAYTITDLVKFFE